MEIRVRERSSESNDRILNSGYRISESEFEISNFNPDYISLAKISINMHMKNQIGQGRDRVRPTRPVPAATAGSLAPRGRRAHPYEQIAVIADVHLGYEWASGDVGDCVPRTRWPRPWRS